MYAEKLPPHDIEAEEAVIGSLVIDGDALLKITSFLKPDDFYRDRNRWCFQASMSLFQRGEAIDQATLAHELARLEHLEEAGGMAFLSHLASTVPTPLHIEHYARIVQRSSVSRQLIHAAEEIAAIGFEEPIDHEASLGRAEDVLLRIRSGRSTQDFVHIREVLDRYLQEELTPLGMPLERGMAPIPTEFPEMDGLLGGLQRSDLVILAARPSLGKSSLALTIARNAAGRGATVAIFSLEMAQDQIVLRLLSAEARVDTHRLRTHMYTDAEHTGLMNAVGVLSDLPLYINDMPGLTVNDIRSRARRLHMERNIDLMVVDYIQLIEGMDGRGQNRVQEVSEITRSLKGLARELNVPLLALSQLSRAVENRQFHRPQLSDLRDSGSIEQDADVVIFIHREDKYITEEEWERQYPDRPYPKNIAELIVAKHRHGPIGSFHLKFEDELAQFVRMPGGGAFA
ncbi:MAG: replicative DNA helicase [Chloroflexi bacterium]|nr:replicative DNA helicase [Chloroflexota bacterium]